MITALQHDGAWYGRIQATRLVDDRHSRLPWRNWLCRSAAAIADACRSCLLPSDDCAGRYGAGCSCRPFYPICACAFRTRSFGRLDDGRTEPGAYIHTFQRVFPHTTLWYTGATHSFLVATPYPLTRDQILALDAQLKRSAAGADLGDGQLLAADLMMHEEEVAAFAANGRVVRDDRAFFIPAMDRKRILAALEPYARAAARDAGR